MSRVNEQSKRSKRTKRQAEAEKAIFILKENNEIAMQFKQNNLEKNFYQ